VLVRVAVPTPAAIAVAALTPLLVPGRAEAHEGESDEAAVLVEQAIALIANDAPKEHVTERIEDALDAPHKEGVDLNLAHQALDVVERPGPRRGVPPGSRRAAASFAGRQAAVSSGSRASRHGYRDRHERGVG
jgi:hypothetical protein